MAVCIIAVTFLNAIVLSLSMNESPGSAFCALSLYLFTHKCDEIHCMLHG